MKPSPLLDLWQKPEGAGDCIGVFATTFTIEPDFFARECLTRALASESLDEGTGSIDDLVARLELEESLLGFSVTVLADRSGNVERTSLRWDLLHCLVRGGLLHSKLTVLLWENATRVIVGSANLTPSGYRTNIELAMAADLGAECLFPRQALLTIADELTACLELTPGFGKDVPVFRRAANTLQLFRERAKRQNDQRTTLRIVPAPTNPTSEPLEKLSDVWGGAAPLQATQISPFWDAGDDVVLGKIGSLLVGRPARDRFHKIAVVPDVEGRIAFPPAHVAKVDEIFQLKPLDQNARRLHAKCLVLQGKDWVAALIGSSNHTKAGLGFPGSQRHREFNLWFGAPLESAEGKALAKLVAVGDRIAPDSPMESCDDEDEPGEIAALPAFFQLCRLIKKGGDFGLHLAFDPASAIDSWRVFLPNDDLVVDATQWRTSGKPDALVRRIDEATIPMFLVVECNGGKFTWGVLVDDRTALPYGPLLKDLRTTQLLDALAAGKSLPQAVREHLLRQAKEREKSEQGEIVTDPLKRFDSHSRLFRRGRALAAALSALEHRLSLRIASLDTLVARLSGPLGPTFIATRLVEECETQHLAPNEALFTLAEIALSLSRVPWAKTLEQVDATEGRGLVVTALDDIARSILRIGKDDSDLVRYAKRAIGEAKRCLHP